MHHLIPRKQFLADQCAANAIFHHNPEKMYLLPCKWNLRRALNYYSTSHDPYFSYERPGVFNSMENCSRIPMEWFQSIWTRITSKGSGFTFFTVRELESRPTFEKGAREQKVKPISLFIRILTRSLKSCSRWSFRTFNIKAMCKDCIKTAQQWFHWHLKLANQKALSHETTWW